MHDKPTAAESPQVSQPAVRPEERRVFARAALRAEVTFEGDTNFYAGFSEDISEGGLFVATYDLKALGDELDLCFELPNGHQVHCRGVVRWVRDTRNRGGEDSPGMGIQFEGISDEDRAAIQAFVAARAPLFYDV